MVGRKTPDRWSMVCSGDVLFAPGRGTIFQVEDMLLEHGYYTRLSVTVRNVLTGNRVIWAVPNDKLLVDSELQWIGEG